MVLVSSIIAIIILTVAQTNPALLIRDNFFIEKSQARVLGISEENENNKIQDEVIITSNKINDNKKLDSSGLPEADYRDARPIKKFNITEEPDITARSAVAVDVATHKVLFDKNATEISSIASITKLMTAMVALEQNPDFNKEYTLKGGFTFSFHYAGHILGAAGIIIRHEGRSAFFSGDIGRLEDMVMRSPESIPAADYLVIESTYGDRLHDKESPLDKLASVVKRTIKRGGVVLIPSFAVGRAQSILYYINELKKQDRIPSNLPVYLDSPMAINATEILCKYADFHKLSQNECNKVCDAAEYVHTPDESKALDHSNVPSIIISASGMATGGRILHHLKRFAPEDKNTLLFTGFQAGGTRGDRIVRGESKVKMHGEMVQINAEVDVMHNASAHADYEEIMTLLSSVKHKPIKVFITHGEPASASAMEERIEEKLGWECTIPKYLQTENL